MQEKTEANMKAAAAGESQAHIKYLMFSDKAEREGKPNIARLFKAISYAERVHATNHFRALGQVGTTEQNLATALAGENYEIKEMYPSFIQAAEQDSEKQAGRSMDWALQAEKGHAVLYDSAINSVIQGQDVAAEAISVCGVCGYTAQGEPPERCPVCAATRDKFEKF